MRTPLLILSLSFAFFVSAQHVDIYSKWTAFPDENTQLILDLSDPSYVSVKLIQVFDQDHHRVDSFGYTRKCSIIYKDLDSSRVFWLAQMESYHPSNREVQYVGEILVTKRDWNNIPIVIKMCDELPDLSISLPAGDTLEYTRMIIDGPGEVTRSYPTFYGGIVEETNYVGEVEGTSGRMFKLGMRYDTLELKQAFKKRVQQKMLSLINSIRQLNGVDSLTNDNRLNSVSSSELDSWVDDMNKYHQIDQYTFYKNADQLIFDSATHVEGYTFRPYPFRCGNNLLAIASTSKFKGSKKECITLLEQNKESLMSHSISVMMKQRGLRQNVLNPGYASVGFDLKLLRGRLDDFYFDENGKQITICRKKQPYYYLLLAQTFSVDHHQ